MKPIYFKKYQQSTDASFVVKYVEVPYTYDKFHFHNEYELTLHIENRGTRFVGDNIEQFDNGDLVIVGPNTPHFWHSDDVYYDRGKNLLAKVVLIQFSRDFLGQDFFSLPEMWLVKEFLAETSRGVQILGTDRNKLESLIMELPFHTGWEQLIKLINILCVLSESTKKRMLASSGFSEVNWMKYNKKIGDIFNFTVKNYKREINLDEISAHANMNKSAFCRYFKKSANKTFTQALNEIRIGFACREMIYSDKTIAEISYESGYANVTYFNRIFKMIKKRTPTEYRAFHIINK